MRFTVGAHYYNVTVEEIIKEVPDSNYTLLPGETAINISCLREELNNCDVILWINHDTNTVSCNTAAVSVFSGEKIIEDTEDFKISQKEKEELIAFALAM